MEMGEIEETGDTYDTRFGHFCFNPSEFEPEIPIWEKEFHLHPRIAKPSHLAKDVTRTKMANKAVDQLKKKFKSVAITNRENMFLWVDQQQNIYYFFINRDEVRSRWTDPNEKTMPNRLGWKFIFNFKNIIILKIVQNLVNFRAGVYKSWIFSEKFQKKYFLHIYMVCYFQITKKNLWKKLFDINIFCDKYFP
jgi:hypothetical protein